MAPKEWRESEKLKLGDVAKRLGCSRMSVWNYETWRRATPLKIALKYEQISKGKVTSDELHRGWLRAQTKQAA